MIANSVVSSSTWTFFHNAILFVDPSNHAYYKPPYSLIGNSCLATRCNFLHIGLEIIGLKLNFKGVIIVLEGTILKCIPAVLFY